MLGAKSGGERATLVRGWLQAAARGRGLMLRFRPGPNPALSFHVEAASPSPVLRPIPTLAAGAEQPGKLHPAGAERLPSGTTQCCRAGCARDSNQVDKLETSAANNS